MVNNQSKKIKTTKDFEIAHLPEEIIRDILVRLPVKSLLKFRCVSKSWFLLISTPEFVKGHLEFSNNNADPANQLITFKFPRKGFSFKRCAISSSIFKTTRSAVDVDYPNINLPMNVKLVSSSNGIICIELDLSFIILWNPSTKKTKVLPQFMGPRSDYVLGFGYSEFEDDYKVVCMYYVRSSLDWKVDIYSSNTDSWKSIEDFRFGVPQGVKGGKAASGKLYFAAFLTKKFVSRKFQVFDIVSFDLKNEAYATIKKPNHEDGCSFTSLGLLGGCLSFVSHYQRIRADVWILKEYDGNKSWTKEVSVPYFNDPLTCSNLYYNPLLIMLNGEVVLSFGGYLVVYNPRDNRHRYSKLTNSATLCVYSESLVSL